jgi:hypothetical protein
MPQSQAKKRLVPLESTNTSYTIASYYANIIFL